MTYNPSRKRAAGSRQEGVDRPRNAVGAATQGDVTTSTARNAAQARVNNIFPHFCIRALTLEATAHRWRWTSGAAAKPQAPPTSSPPSTPSPTRYLSLAPHDIVQRWLLLLLLLTRRMQVVSGIKTTTDLVATNGPDTIHLVSTHHVGPSGNVVSFVVHQASTVPHLSSQRP
jgi:hypothetical protein